MPVFKQNWQTDASFYTMGVATTRYSLRLFIIKPLILHTALGHKNPRWPFGSMYPAQHPLSLPLVPTAMVSFADHNTSSSPS
jgi:hypothetical protein